MLKRVLSGAVLTLVLLATILFARIPFILNGVIALIAGMGLYEILTVSGFSAHRGLKWCGVLFAAAFVFCSDPVIPQYRQWLTLATFCMLLGTFAFYLKRHDKIPPEKMLFFQMITLLIAYFFSAPVLIYRENETGVWGLVLIFLLAWIPDTGAYFCGSLFGKHKLAPVISPKKTVEGAVGGLIVCIGVTALYGWLLTRFANVTVAWLPLLICAAVGAIVSVLGDLTASLIKRHYGVKDYSNLIPGHGGIMDRFDSVWFTAPFLYLFTALFPVFTL